VLAQAVIVAAAFRTSRRVVIIVPSASAGGADWGLVACAFFNSTARSRNGAPLPIED
jgi:hypothetical protein